MLGEIIIIDIPVDRLRNKIVSVKETKFLILKKLTILEITMIMTMIHILCIAYHK